MQFRILQKISPTLISLYNNVPFIFECLHDEQHTYCNEKASQKYWTRKSPDSQNIFLSSSSLDTLIKNWWLFHDGFCTKQQHFTLSSVLAHRFFTTLKSHEEVRTSHWRTMALLAMPFSKIVHMHANHLATKPFLFKLEIRLCAWRREESWHPLLTQCLKRAWSMISANTAYIYQGSLWGQTCCSVIDGKLQLKHMPVSNKKWHKQDPNTVQPLRERESICWLKPIVLWRMNSLW